MIKCLLSPSEVDLAKAMIGEVIISSLPEQKGADILIYSPSGLMGIQRKKVPQDFISSFTDGRMTRALSLLKENCTHVRLVCESHFRYWPDGTVFMGMAKGGKRVPSRFTRGHIHGMLNDVELVHGVIPRWTDDLEDTVRYIKSVRDFLSKSKHLGLYSRPSAKGTWYVPTTKDLYLWILQSFPGIGPAIADNILIMFGGRLPLKWDCTFSELSSVQSLGKKRAEILWNSIPGGGIVHPSKSVFDELRKMIGSD